MNAQNQINFLSGKILELGTAILTYETSTLLKLPSTIVEASYVDETGCIWLSVINPTQHLSEFDKSFRVALNYYRKGKPFYLNVSGIARIVNDPEDINHLQPFLKKAIDAGKILISVRIAEADYHESQHKPEENFLQKCMHTISSVLTGPGEYYYFRFKDAQHFA